MPELVNILMIILVIAIIWMVIKLVFKLTTRIFSCGCLLLLVIGAILFFSGYLQILPKF